MIELYADDESRQRYGVTARDTWSLDVYLAKVISNGLRLLAQNTYGWPNGFENQQEWQDALENAAMKLEFYALDVDQVIFDNIDWSNDVEKEHFMDWAEMPGQQEFTDKALLVDEVQDRFCQEALEWLTKYWRALWS